MIEKYAEFAYLVHLWNVQVGEKIEHNHYPALPEADAKDGWAPIEEYLRMILERNHDVKIMFEHRSDLINDAQLEQCYSWVQSIVN